MPSTTYLVTIHTVFETKDSHLEPPKGEEVLKLLEAMFAKSKEYWTVGDSRTKGYSEALLDITTFLRTKKLPR